MVEKKNLNEQFKELFSQENFQKLQTYAKENTGDTASYALLFIGLLISLVNPLWGSALIGLVAGYYFYEDIFEWSNHLQEWIQEKGALKITIIGLIVALFFLAYPLFFIAAGLVIAIMQVINLMNKKN